MLVRNRQAALRVLNYMNTVVSVSLTRCASSFVAAVAFSAVVLPPSAAWAQAPKPTSERLAAMEKEIEKQRIATGVPGVALVVVQGDQIIYLKGLGLRDVANKKPVTPDTLFAIGSSTKAFTAVSVLMSRDDGKLSLDDSPKKVLPYFKLQDPEADKNMTIRDLMCHDSGLPRTDIAWVGGFLTREEGIRLLADVKPTAPFRKVFQYQNLMFSAAGEIASQVQKTSYEQLIKSRILKPLQMTHSNLSVRDLRKAPDFAIGYSPDAAHLGSHSLTLRDIDAVAPAGAINSSARDMAQWLRFLLKRGVGPDGKRLLTEASFAEMVKPQMTILPKAMDYGLGWFVRKWRGTPLLEHGGNIDGFNAEVAFLPEKNLGFVLLTNVSASPLAQASLETVWSNLVDLPPDAKPTEPAIADAGPVVVASQEEAGTYALGGAGVKATVAFEENKLTFSVPGQPIYPLLRLSGRRYKLAAPAPDGFFITFRSVKDKSAETEASLEQPNGTFLLKKDAASAAFVSPITIDDLLAKMVTASGGEATLRKHTSLAVKSHAVLENQGLVADVDSLMQSPNRREQKVTFIALGKKTVGILRDYFDGTGGGLESNFMPSTTYEGGSLSDTVLQSYLHPVLEARKLFPRLEITGKETRNGEEMLVVKKTPAKGGTITEYVSPKSFLVLRRDFAPSASGSALAPAQGHTEIYEDYRAVDGEMIPYKTTTASATLGKQVETVVSAAFNGSVPKNAFLPASSGKETSLPTQK